MGFESIIGQKEVQERLMQMVSEDRLPHALMLCGPQGIGKMAIAIAFACRPLRRQCWKNWSILTCILPILL